MPPWWAKEPPEEGEPDPRGGWGWPMQPDPRQEEPAEGGRRYVCAKCKEELLLAYCKKVERMPPTPGAVATVRIVHACPCIPQVRATRYPWDTTALDRLFGSRDYVLPWPQAYGEDYGSVAEPVEPDNRSPKDKALARFSWEMEGVSTAQEFLNKMRGPWLKDQDIRLEFRRVHGEPDSASPE